MVFLKESAYKTAEILLQVKAVKLEPAQPFTWASGWKSPIYTDNRVLLSFPAYRTYFKEQLVKVIEDKYSTVNVIAGVATGAIALGALVADEMGLPFVYVRPEPKSHGRQNQIEGMLDSGQNVVVVEDLVSTGKSSLQAVDALVAHGARVLGMVANFTYGFPLAEKNFKDQRVELHTLCDYEHLIDYAQKKEILLESDISMLKDWRKNPESWEPKKAK
jgi:orotate phosphoribosyltransferase